MSLMADNMASRKAEEAALRRHVAVHWLECFVGPVRIPNQPSEKEFISCLRNGIILCKVINKIQPGSVPKVVEKHAPMQSDVWDSQPLPAYQYFENVRNFLVAVRELKLPAFEASDLERENVEAGSACRVSDCILALKSYHEWKEWSGGKGVYKHVTAKSPLLHSAAKNFSRPLSTIEAQSCRRLDMSATNDKQSLTDSIIKALTGHMIDSKENISGNYLTSLQNGNQDPVQVFTELLSRCLEEKLNHKFPMLKSDFQDNESEESVSHTEPASVLQENTSIQNDSKPCKAWSIKRRSYHRQVLRSQEKELSYIKVLWIQTKTEFDVLQSQFFNDLKQLENLVEEMSTPARGYQKVVRENRKLYNMVQDLKGNIRVHCRIRPILNAETVNVIDFVGDDGSVVVVDPLKLKDDGRKVFQFTQVYGPMATQDELFKDAQPLIRSVLDGFNVCILAYGHTLSGKTHTMYGPSGAPEKEKGIIFLALNDLFQMVDERTNIIKYEVSVQMVNICNEELRDLLAEDSESHGELGLHDVTMHHVRSNADAINLVKHGEAMNNENARSHSVVTVHILGKDTSGNILRSQLQLVDLAGSGEIDKMEESKDGQKNNQLIDKSLSCLKDVITALSKKSSNIPYRNSKLTSLLQDGLGAHAKILMFVHVSPEGNNLGETVNSLKFAQKVSTVELGAAQSKKTNIEVMELKQEIEYLKSALMEKGTETRSIRQVRSPCEKPRSIGEKSPLRSRRLSLENSVSVKTEKLPKSPLPRPKTATYTTPQKSQWKNTDNGSARNGEKTREIGAAKPKEPKSPCEKATLEGSIPRPRRLSIENSVITRTEKPQKLKEPKSPNDTKKGATKRTPPLSRRVSIESPNSSKPNGCTSKIEAPTSPLTSSHQHQFMTFTDCAVKFPSIQPPRTPEQPKLHQHEMSASLNSGASKTKDSKTPNIAKSTNGKGSQLRKSLRTIGKLINGSEKRNQQKRNEALSMKANEAKSPTKARVLRRQSLTGIPPPGSDRRSSLGGTNDNRNAKTPPPVRSSTKITKQWM